MSPGINVIPPTSIVSPDVAAERSSIDAIRLPSSATSWEPGSAFRPSKIRAFVSSTIGSPSVLIARAVCCAVPRPAPLAEAPVGREPLVVLADPVGHPAVERGAIELVRLGVGSQLTPHRLEHAREDAAHVLALMLLVDLEERLLREDGVVRP